MVCQVFLGMRAASITFKVAFPAPAVEVWRERNNDINHELMRFPPGACRKIAICLISLYASTASLDVCGGWKAIRTVQCSNHLFCFLRSNFRRVQTDILG